MSRTPRKPLRISELLSRSQVEHIASSHFADTQFFEAFKEFEGRAFHMSGESYGVSCTDFLWTAGLRKGRYLPLFSSAVYDGNAGLIAEGKAPINIQSVLIGNGITDARECCCMFREAKLMIVRMTESYFPFVGLAPAERNLNSSNSNAQFTVVSTKLFKRSPTVLVWPKR